MTAVEGVGAGSVSGETRRRIVEAREKTRSLLLTKSLEQHRPRKDRHVMGWRQRDNLSSSWILAVPGVDTSLSRVQ